MRLSIQDAAELLQVSEKTIYRWIRGGILPAYRINEQYRFQRAELLAWAVSRRVNVSEDAFHDALRVSGPIPTLVEAVALGGIHYQLEGSNKSEALAHLARAFRFDGAVDRDYVLSLMLARESLGPTGVGGGLAIPQLIYPNLLEIAPPAIAIAFLEHPVDYDALDGMPVTCLLGLFSPTLRGYHFLFNRLHYCLRDDDFRAALLGADGRSVLQQHLHRLESGLRKSP